MTLDEVERVAVTTAPGLAGALSGLSVAKALAWHGGYRSSSSTTSRAMSPPSTSRRTRSSRPSCACSRAGHDAPRRARAGQLAPPRDDARRCSREAFDKEPVCSARVPGRCRDRPTRARGRPSRRSRSWLPGCPGSTSVLGLKTALLYTVRDLREAEAARQADLAASYERAIVRALAGRAYEAAEQTSRASPSSAESRPTAACARLFPRRASLHSRCARTTLR